MINTNNIEEEQEMLKIYIKKNHLIVVVHYPTDFLKEYQFSHVFQIIFLIFI